MSRPGRLRLIIRFLVGARRLCFPAKEALTTVDRASLGGPEGNRRFPAALRTDCCCLRSRRSGRRRSLPLYLARLAALGFILEVLVVEEMLLSRRENELRSTISALDNPILKLWHRHRSRGPTQSRPFKNPYESGDLFDLPPTFLPVSLTSQCLLGPLFLSRLQIERVPFDLFNNVLLLDLTLEAAKGVF